MKNLKALYFVMAIFACVSCGDDGYENYDGNENHNNGSYDNSNDVSVPRIGAEYREGVLYISFGEEIDSSAEYLLYMSTSYNGTYKYIEYDNFYRSGTGVTFMTKSIDLELGVYYFRLKVNGYYSNIASVTIKSNDSNDSNDSGNDGGGAGDNSGNSGNNNGDSGGGTVIQKPSTPYGLSVTNEGSNSYPGVKISWSYVSNATSYKVYRSSYSSSGFTQIGTTEYNYYTDWNPQSGKNYYKVTAVNEGGESAQSSYVMFNYDTSSSLTPSTPKVSISGSSSLTLTWSCTTGNGYGKAKSYEVHKRNPNTAEYELLETTTNTRYTDYNPHPGYNRYAVVAKNDAGESAAAQVMSESVELDYPSSFSAYKSGDYVNFTWSKVSEATGYQIFCNTSAYGDYYILGQVDDVNTTTKSIYYPASSGTKVYFKIKAYYNAKYIGSPVYSDLSSYKMVTF